MKIIEPSAEIIEDELAQLSIYQRIDRCASVCYQRPPKPTEDEAREFCRKMVDVKHMSTLEMGTVHLFVDDPAGFPESDYIKTKYIDGSTWNYIVSGSIRAFIESPGEYGSPVWDFLAAQYPVFFAESDKPDGSVRFARPDEIPWKHKYVAVRFIVNRAVSHELVRHRPCSFLQESQRYCRYEDEVVFIRPEWFDELKYMDGRTIEHVWHDRMASAEAGYRVLINNGLKPQQARAVLPNSTKTELICYASLPQWQHIFKLRCSAAADPEMRRIMVPLREEFKSRYPEVEW